MADPRVIGASQVAHNVTANATISVGDLLYHDGTGMNQADADSNATWAEYIALMSGDTTYNTKISVAKVGQIEDTDAPYTAEADVWLSGTAGGHTETKLTGSDDLEQRVGWVIDTSRLFVQLGFPQMAAVPMIQKVTNSGETATALDTGAVAGDQLNADTEITYSNFVIPGGFISWEATRAWTAVETDVSFDYTVSVASAESGEGHDVETSAPDTAAANGNDFTLDTVNAIDISGAFDLAGISEPGKFMGVKFLRDSSGTAAMLVLGFEMSANCV